MGEYFASPRTPNLKVNGPGIRIHVIYASPLLRAHTTAKQIHSFQSPSPPLIVSDLIREQHWGDAEGHPFTWDDDDETVEEGVESGQMDSKGRYAPLRDRISKFSNGESSEDVARRADEFISEHIIHHVMASLPDDAKPLNIFVVSHGICIAELIAAFLRRDPANEYVNGGDEPRMLPESWRGLANTGWTRLEVSLYVSILFTALVASTAPDFGKTIRTQKLTHRRSRSSQKRRYKESRRQQCSPRQMTRIRIQEPG